MWYTDHMADADSIKLEQIIVMLSDIVVTFGERFDKIDERLLGLANKSAALTGASTQKQCAAPNLKVPKRVHDLEENAYGRGRSKHPKHLPL